VAALAGLVLAHGGTAGLVVEIATVVAIAGLLLWAAVKSRSSNHEEGDP
jgi:hypothetical protein